MACLWWCSVRGVLAFLCFESQDLSLLLRNSNQLWLKKRERESHSKSFPSSKNWWESEEPILEKEHASGQLCVGLWVLAGRTACEVPLRAEFVPCPAADAHDSKTPLQTSKLGVTIYNLFCSLSWLVVKTGEKSSKQISETVLNPYVGH